MAPRRSGSARPPPAVNQTLVFSALYLSLGCASPVELFAQGSTRGSKMGPGSPQHRVLTSRELRRGRKCFVETGTNKGDSTLAVAPFYPAVTTIEKFEPVFRSSRARIKGDPAGASINSLLGDTVDRLPEVVGAAPHFAACVFWLDAHNTYGIEGWAASPVNPILRELSIIMAARRSQESHIVLDDYRLFGVNDSVSLSPAARKRYAPYPSAAAVRDLVCAQWPKAQFLVGLDTMHVSLGAGKGHQLPLDNLTVA